MADNPIFLPKGAKQIPKAYLVPVEPLRLFRRTSDFLAALDGKVRKAPAEGVTIEEACALMRKLGGTLTSDGLRRILVRTRTMHVLAVHKDRVRLSTDELVSRVNREWKQKR